MTAPRELTFTYCNPNLTKPHTGNIRTIKNKQFVDTQIEVDNTTFKFCQFDQVNFIFRGLGPCELITCKSHHTRFLTIDRASDAMQYLEIHGRSHEVPEGNPFDQIPAILKVVAEINELNWHPPEDYVPKNALRPQT